MLSHRRQIGISLSVQSHHMVGVLLQSSTPTNNQGSEHKVHPKKPILVIGATGKLGSCIVSKLSQRKIPYRCIVRPSSKNIDRITQYLSSGDDGQRKILFEGDLSNYNNVHDAVCNYGGISGCICVSGSFRKRRASDLLLSLRGGKRSINDSNHPYIVNHVGMQNLCRAIRELNKINGDGHRQYQQHLHPTKIVKVSGVLLSLPRWHYISILGNILYSGVMRWHKEGECDIINSGLPYTILRPGSFRDESEFGHLKKELVISEDGALKPMIKVKKPIIGLDDLADICIECLGSSIERDDKVLYPKWVER